MQKLRLNLLLSCNFTIDRVDDLLIKKLNIHIHLHRYYLDQIIQKHVHSDSLKDAIHIELLTEMKRF